MSDWICPRCDAVQDVSGECPDCSVGRHSINRVPVSLHAPSTPNTASDPLLGCVLGEDLLVRCIGRGGFGAVYLALRGELGIKVAVKVLLPDIADAMLDSLRHEGQALARLHHPNIVRVLGYGEQSGQTWLTTEFVESGLPLDDAMRQRDLSVDDKHGILRSLVYALDAAHNQGLIHRDIKPANIMLQSVEGDPNFVRLLDFGIAKDVSLTDHTAAIRGTPGYLAPEQVLGRGIGPHTDLFAVGLLACQMLWGRPFFGGTALQVVRARGASDFDLGHYFSDCPSATRAFAARALARRPADRYDSAAAFLSGLASMVDDAAARTGVTESLGPTLVGVDAASAETLSLVTDDLESLNDARRARPPTGVEPEPNRRPTSPIHLSFAVIAVMAMGFGFWWFLTPGPEPVAVPVEAKPVVAMPVVAKAAGPRSVRVVVIDAAVPSTVGSTAESNPVQPDAAVPTPDAEPVEVAKAPAPKASAKRPKKVPPKPETVEDNPPPISDGIKSGWQNE